MPPSIVPFILMLFAAGMGLCMAAAWIMAWSLAHPPRMTDGKAAWVLRRLSPTDVGLEFEDISFQVRDEKGAAMKIGAWWIPNPQSERCVVLVHGYADAKVGAISWAPAWHALGFNLLVPDLRAHGDSEGTACTAGYFERHDLSQVIDQLRAARPVQTREIVLAGMSLGAAVAAATAVQTSDVAAVVMDSPYADFRRAAIIHMDRLGAPGRLLQRFALRLAEWLTRANYDAVRPIDLIPQLCCPVLVIVSGNDPFLSPSDHAALDNAVRAHRPERGPAQLWTLDRTGHLMAISADPEAYRRRINGFLGEVREHQARWRDIHPGVVQSGALHSGIESIRT
jgi:uncharacterized protein